jgi:hypothetical protein
MKRTQVTAHAGNAVVVVVVVVVVVIREMVKPSTELQVIQYPFNSAALSNSTDTVMLTCALCVSPHINSELQVAVTSIPHP